MPYTNEQWEYFSNWKNFSKEKDIQYSKQEFDYFLNRIKNNQPFSIVRFGEGESRVVLKEQTLERSELSFNPQIESEQTYVKELEECAKINDPNYFVGIQSYTYKPAEKNRPENEFILQRNKVIELGNLPKEQYTCSRVFCNFYKECNTELLNVLRTKNIYLVCSEQANISNLNIPIKKVWKINKKNAWKHNTNLYSVVYQEMNNITNSVLICCAGFFGNILISKLEHGKNFNINVGSVYDPLLFNKTTRPYQREKI